MLARFLNITVTVRRIIYSAIYGIVKIVNILLCNVKIALHTSPFPPDWWPTGLPWLVLRLTAYHVIAHFALWFPMQLSHSLPHSLTDCLTAACPHCLKSNRQLETEEGNFASCESTTAAASLYLTFEYIASSSFSLCAGAAAAASLQYYLEEFVRELYGGIIKFAS